MPFGFFVFSFGKNERRCELSVNWRFVLTAPTEKVKIFLCLALFLSFHFFSGVPAFSQEEQGEKRQAFGLGAEYNMNSRFGFSLGPVFSFDYALPYALATGFFVKYSHNFASTIVFEGAVLIRRYIPGRRHAGFFAQADIGFHTIMEEEIYTIGEEEIDVEVSDVWTTFEAGLWLGFRQPLGRFFYIEPYARVGYPFLFGAGLLVGFRD